jgi:GrpB-like predicted nucleotidyltransferase (UPF0157 family)
MKVTVADYDPAWPEIFRRERALLEAALGDGAGIVEHIGSTSVPGLAAKPIIDIMIGLHDFSQADRHVPRIEALGYEYVPQYEEVMPDRRYFKKKIGATATHHVHMVERGGAFWTRHLLFRDHLRANPDAAAEYAALKKRLAEIDWADKSGYLNGKTDFVLSIERKAGWQG